MGIKCAGEDTLQDVCYHLLRLYCDRSHSLSSLLNPATITPDPLDYRISWHLQQILQSLHYKHLTEYQHAALCSSFAAQLETVGLWHWALFVLLHIPEHTQREAAAKALLMRHATLTDDEEQEEREKFITQKLRVPSQWIYHAKVARHFTILPSFSYSSNPIYFLMVQLSTL